MAEYDIGVCIFFLNEVKFLPYSVRSFVKCKAVKSIVLVEGCAHTYPKDRVTSQGLSTDGSSTLAIDLAAESDKVEYIPVGWVNTKAELQNRGFHVIRARLGEAAIFMLAGADELYHAVELERLQQCFRANPKAKQVVYPFFHFWWRPDLVASGSSWDALMHRAYRRPGLPMKFAHHASPPADCGRGPKIHALDEQGRYVCRCFHYVGMQDEQSIAAKLQMYTKRDAPRLKVTDTWTGWKWGEKTQWTHAGGSVKRFDGDHPEAIQASVWNLTPRDAAGKLLPLPEVPWDNETSHITTPPASVAVFVEGRRIPSNPYIAGLISHLHAHHKLTVYTLDGQLDDAEKYQVRKYKSFAFNLHTIAILFPETFILRPLGSKYVAVLWKDLEFELDFTGYTVFRTDDIASKYPLMPLASEFVGEVLKAPAISTGRIPSPPGPKPRASILPRDGDLITPRAGRHSAEGIMQVRITNVTAHDWVRAHHFVGCFWATNRGQTKPDAPRTKANLPKEKVRPGETMVCDVVMPNPPRDVENGFLQLCIDILDQPAGRWLNVGVKVPRTIRNWKVFR